MKGEKTLLSIDWDWITGDCSPPKSHGCCGWCQPTKRRKTRGGIKKLKENWCNRLNLLRTLSPIDTGGGLWIAECHADILKIANPDFTNRIVHLDSHTDDADWFGLCCGSWISFLPNKIAIETDKKWLKTKSHGRRIKGTTEKLENLVFYDVFCCLSSPWTPKSMDHFFWDLIYYLANEMNVDPLFIGHRHVELARDWRKYERSRTRTNKGIGLTDSLSY